MCYWTSPTHARLIGRAFDVFSLHFCGWFLKEESVGDTKKRYATDVVAYEAMAAAGGRHSGCSGFQWAVRGGGGR